MSNFIERVPRTSTSQAEAGARYANQLARNLKHAGLAMHNAVVDLAFSVRPGFEDATQQVPADALFVPVTTGAEALIRANALRPYLTRHMLDGTYAHIAADTVSAAIIAAADATDQTTLSVLLEEYRAAINAHLARTTSHNRMLFQPSIVTTAVDEASNILVTNALLLNIESHYYSAASTLDIDPI